jgi:hypothetical protein
MATPETDFPINEGAVRDFLARHNWPYGLQDVVIEGFRKVPLRFFICDDSGSMNESDGNRLVSSSSSSSSRDLGFTPVGFTWYLMLLTAYVDMMVYRSLSMGNIPLFDQRVGPN